MKKRRDTGCLMMRKDDGQCSHQNMQISEMVSDALFYSNGDKDHCHKIIMVIVAFLEEESNL